jgi:hypothetical protein
LVTRREQLVWYEELAAALAEKLAAEKEEAMDEAYTRVGMDVTRGAGLVSVLDNPSSALDNPSSAAAVVAGASVSLAVLLQ